MKKKNTKPTATHRHKTNKKKKTGGVKKHFTDNPAHVYEGTIEITRHGYGFVIVDSRPGDDIIVRQKQLGGAMTGDRVTVQITNTDKNREEGKVTKIVTHAHHVFNGYIQIKKDFAFVVLDKKYGSSRDIYVPITKINKAKDGDQVVVAITDWNDHKKNPFGKVTDVLSGAPLKEIMWKTILMDAGFPLKFPGEVLQEVSMMTGDMDEKEIKKRRDFRGVTTFTIDPTDAKDFDDAISFKKISDNKFEIGVHIADVSHYVKPGTALDKHAQVRCTSVYLVDGTLPMLPEKISNEWCSLRPNEDKYCFSAVFTLDSNANILTEWFGRTVIHSMHRFTYEGAQEVLETGAGVLKDELKTINQLAYRLREKRFKEGSINFDTVETKFKLDEAGKPIAIILKERKDAHLLIEDFMLLANKQVAAFVSAKKPAVPFPYRVHDLPDIEKLKDFNQFAKQFGYKLNLTSPMQIAQSFNKMTEALKGKNEENMLTMLAIRCMAKATYTTNNIGHYGLGFKTYAHFTSPIRRYPDVLAHRILQNVLLQKNEPYSELDELCKRSSEQEKKAATAERESIKYKQAEYLEGQTGKIFDGIISGVTSFGIFVEMIENKCEGMVSLRNMSEPFVFDEKNFSVTGRYSGEQYKLGDRVRVILLKSSPEKKQIDLQLVDD